MVFAVEYLLPAFGIGIHLAFPHGDGRLLSQHFLPQKHRQLLVVANRISR